MIAEVAGRVSRRVLALVMVSFLAFAGALVSTAPAAAQDDPTYPRLLETTPRPGWLASNTDDEGKLTEVTLPALFQLETAPGELAWAYCLDVDKTAIPGEYYEAEAPKMNRQAAWIAQNSFPNMSLAELEAASSVSGIDEAMAVTATSMAIWNVTGSDRYPGISFDYWDQYEIVNLAEDETGMDGSDRTPVAPEEIDTARDLYSYLVSNSEDAEEPVEPTLELSGDASGEAGQRIGPLTLTGSPEVRNTMIRFDSLPDGVTLVDGSGNEIRRGDAITIGTEIYADVAADASPGSIEVSVTALQRREAGTSFRGRTIQLSPDGPEYEPQPLILAEPSAVDVTVKGQLSWAAPQPTPTEEPTTPTEEPTAPTEEPSDDPSEKPRDDRDDDGSRDKPRDDRKDDGRLPRTGTELMPMAMGAVLLGLGITAITVTLRRRNR